jgi:phosphoglycerol transferase MdoB-like AlkP superfamily enzyme
MVIEYARDVAGLEKANAAEFDPETPDAVIATMASQIDLAPTLLSLMGVASEHPMIGRDLVRDSTSPGRALLQFDNYFAYLEGSQATILRASGGPLLGRYDTATGVFDNDAGTPTQAQVDRAMAHVMLPSLMYREGSYRLPPPAR